MSKTLKIILGILALILFPLYFFFKGRTSKDEDPLSNDPSVSETISIIDTSINKIFRYNKDHEPIFLALDKLSKEQVLKLHSDFGYRYYNKVTGMYSFFQVLEGYAVARKTDLTGIYHNEFDDKQLSKLKQIYTNKGLSYPIN